MITHFCIKNSKDTGNIKGICCVCGQKTNEGHKPCFSDNFTGYSYLTHGDCMCPYCYMFFKDQSFRKKSWVATSEGVKFLKRLECKDVILNPPEPPFFLYITQTGQRQGWLSAMKLINYNKEKFYISTDWVGHFLVNMLEVNYIDSLLRILRKEKVSKTALLLGDYNLKLYRKAMEEGWDRLLGEAKNQIKNPLWEVMVYVTE